MTTDKTKFTGLSPLTTKLLRQRLEFQIKSGEVGVGRTIATFMMSANKTDAMIDHLIATEIPGSGASSKEVKRLRDLRARLRGALAGDAETGVVLIVPDGELRSKILDIVAAGWWANVSSGGWADELDELACDGCQQFDRDQMRTWLDEVL